MGRKESHGNSVQSVWKTVLQSFLELHVSNRPALYPSQFPDVLLFYYSTFSLGMYELILT